MHWMMADQEMEDAVIIQEASAKIAKVSEKLSGLETNSQEVVAAQRFEQQSWIMDVFQMDKPIKLLCIYG